LKDFFGSVDHAKMLTLVGQRIADGRVLRLIVLDAYSRRVIGWALDRTMEDELTLAALRMALARRVVEAGLVHHSDRGSQYASNDYTDLLKANGITISMSRKGNPWDNAACESFMKTLKCEEVHRIAANAPAHRLDEFPAGYCLAGWSPPEPTSASPAEFDCAVESSCRSNSFQRTANSVLTGCVSRGGKRNECAVVWRSGVSRYPRRYQFSDLC
jgi:transposase InsO family protein